MYQSEKVIHAAPGKRILFPITYKKRCSIPGRNLILNNKITIKMKKFFSILLLIALMAKTDLQAQTCASVTAELTAVSPQSEFIHWFGIKVSIAQPYNQNVTVSGTITDTEGASPSTWQLTILAGSLTAETSSNFYSTDPQWSARVYIDNVTPCPPSVNQVAANSNNPFDYYGYLHNDILDYFITTQPVLNSANDVSVTINNYYQSKGWNYNATSFFSNCSSYRTSFENASTICDVFTANNFSGLYCSYYNSLNSLLDNVSDYTTFKQNIISLEGQISGNTQLSQTEKEILLTCASIERYSSYYWSINSNINNWLILRGGNTSQYRSSWSWGSLGKADLKGAIEGGVAGAIIGGSSSLGTLTVPSWVAGAVSWGGACSASNAIGQLTGWW